MTFKKIEKARAEILETSFSFCFGNEAALGGAFASVVQRSIMLHLALYK